MENRAFYLLEAGKLEERPCEMTKDNWETGGSQVTEARAISVAAEARWQSDALVDTKRWHSG